jgi:hypothetical protein
VCLPNLDLTFCSDVDEFLDMDGSIYLDPHECVRHLEHHSLLGIELMYFQWGVNINTWTWDLSLWMNSLDYFNVEVSTCTWNLATLALRSTLIHGTQVYGGDF